MQETSHQTPIWETSVRIQAWGRRKLKPLIPYLLLAPAFGLLAAILIYPILYNIYLSFWDWRFTAPADRAFINLDNYIYLFTEDPVFWKVFRFTMTFTALTIGLEFIIGLISALLLNGIRTLQRIFSSMLLLPYMVAPIAVGLIWKLLWAREFGLVNYFLTTLGFDRVNWLGEGTNAALAVVIAEVWRSTPFVTLILLAGLTSIPSDIMEAALVDGASRWHTFRYITLPLLAPSITVALVFQTIFKLRVFDLIFIMTNGGPGTDTLPLGILVYRTYFRYMNGGYAAAQSVVLLLLGAAISALYLRLIYREIEY